MKPNGRFAAAVAVVMALSYPQYKGRGWQFVNGVSVFAPQNRGSVEQRHRLEPGLAPGSRVLFLDDPVPADRYNLLFMVRLSYGDRSLMVERAKQGPVAPQDRYGYIFDYRDARFVELKRPG